MVLGVNFLKKKKTDHIIISSQRKKLRHQNIHVMFSYAIIIIHKKNKKEAKVEIKSRANTNFWNDDNIFVS